MTIRPLHTVREYRNARAAHRAALAITHPAGMSGWAIRTDDTEVTRLVDHDVACYAHSLLRSIDPTRYRGNPEIQAALASAIAATEHLAPAIYARQWAQYPAPETLEAVR
jgi:hypothetical protein